MPNSTIETTVVGSAQLDSGDTNPSGGLISGNTEQNPPANNGGGGDGSGDYAMAIVVNNEGPILTGQKNIDHIEYDGVVLRLHLAIEVSDQNKACLSATLLSPSNPPNTISASMEDQSNIAVKVLDVDGTPVFVGCCVRLAIAPF